MWYLQESNQGHTDFQSVALPTELRYHAVLSGCKYNFKIRIYKQKPEKKVFIFSNSRSLRYEFGDRHRQHPYQIRCF